MATNTIVLYYTPNEAPDSEVPFAIRGYYSKDVWEKRVNAFVKKASRYYKRVFEWVWMIIFFAAMIAVPIVIYRVAYQHLPKDPKNKKIDDDDHWWWYRSSDRVWKARLIALASWSAVCLLCYIPIFVWKIHGRKVVNKMLEKWEKEDKAQKPNVEIPKWHMRTPGYLSNSIKLVIRVPSTVPTSSFHPTASLPAYVVNGPVDSNVAYYYQPSPQLYPSGYPTTPGAGVPIFNVQDQAQGGYDPRSVQDPEKLENIRI